MATVGDKLRWVRRRVSRYAGPFGAFRGAWLAWRDRPGARGTLELTWPGYPHPFVLRAGGSDLRTFCHVIAGAGYELPWDLDPEVIVDGGANVGLAAVYFAHRYPNARVLAVEPDPDNFALLVANTAGYPNVACTEAALWDACGPIPLADPGQGEWAYRVDPSAERARAVAGIDLPTLLADAGCAHADVVKLDIEGAEVEVLGDAARWIDGVSVVVAELHDRFRPGASEAFLRATEGFGDRVERDEDVFVRRT